MQQFISEIRCFCDRVRKDNISVYSAYGTLFIILSVIPFMMLLLTLVQYLPITEEQLISIIGDILPEAVTPVFQFVVTDLRVSSPSTLLSVTAVFTLWSASKGILGIFRGMNSVYHSFERRNYIWLRIICLFYTIAFYIIVLFTLILMVFGEQLQILLINQFQWLGRFDQLISFLRLLLSIFLQTFFFMVVYKVFPDRKASIWTQIPGALVSSVGWMLFSYAFSIYIKYFSGYSRMYGSLTTVMLSILWMYVCICIILFGGELNAWLEETEELSVD